MGWVLWDSAVAGSKQQQSGNDGMVVVAKQMVLIATDAKNALE